MDSICDFFQKCTHLFFGNSAVNMEYVRKVNKDKLKIGENI